MEELKPEAAYFTDVDGSRGGYLLVNMDDASQLPTRTEPLFFGLGATIRVHLVMWPLSTSRGRPQRWSKRHRSTARESTALLLGVAQGKGRVVGCFL